MKLLDLSREYSKKLFGPMFDSWCSCPLRAVHFSMPAGCKLGISEDYQL